MLDGEVLGVDEDAKPAGVPGHDERVRPGRRVRRGRGACSCASSTSSTATAPISSTSRSPPRQQHLDAVVGELAIPRVVTDDPAEAQRLLDESLATGHEGAMVKAID